MSTESLSRWSGVMSILAGLLFALATIIHPFREDAAAVPRVVPQLLAGHWLFAASALPMLLGLVGLYVTQAKQSKWLGLVGFLLSFTGILLVFFTGFIGFTLPLLAEKAPDLIAEFPTYPPILALGGLTIFTFLPGLILFGMAVIRSRVLPPEGGLLLLIGGPVWFGGLAAMAVSTSDTIYFVAIVGAVLLGLGFILLGRALWSQPKQAAA